MTNGADNPVLKFPNLSLGQIVYCSLFSTLIGGVIVLLTWTGACAAPVAVDSFSWPVVLTQVEIKDPHDVLITPVPGTLLNVERRMRVILLQPGREPEVLLPAFYATAETDVFFDGKKLLVAGKPTAESPWNIFELDLETRTLCQVTHETSDCRCPSYQSTQYILDAPLPWFQLTFLRSLPAEKAILAPGVVTALFSCQMDGSHFRRITVNHSPDLPGTLLPDGRIVYASFRSSCPAVPGVRVDLMAVNTDGTDPANFLPRLGARYKFMPALIPRGLLGTLVFVENDELTPDGAGQLASVDLRRPLRTYRRITNDAAWLYHSPSALPNGRLLVSRRPRDGKGSYAVGIFDLQTANWTPLFDDPRYHDIFAKPVAPRPLPDGRSSGVNDASPTGTLYCLSVYDTDLGKAGFPKGSIKKVRFLEALTNAQSGKHALGEVPFRVLGEIPVYPDGSFQVDVPSDKPIALQLIDENGMNQRTSGWFWVKGSVHQGCIGCHEDPERVPFNKMADALWEERPRIEPNSSFQPPDFVHDVWPIVERTCLECHKDAQAVPRLVPDLDNQHPGAANPYPSFAFAALRSFGFTAPTSNSSSQVPYIVPGTARLSPLVWHLVSRNLARPWDAQWQTLPFKPWPTDSSNQRLSDKDLRTIIEWIDMGAIYDRGRYSQSP